MAHAQIPIDLVGRRGGSGHLGSGVAPITRKPLVGWETGYPSVSQPPSEVRVSGA